MGLPKYSKPHSVCGRLSQSSDKIPQTMANFIDSKSWGSSNAIFYALARSKCSMNNRKAAERRRGSLIGVATERE